MSFPVVVAKPKRSSRECGRIAILTLAFLLAQLTSSAQKHDIVFTHFSQHDYLATNQVNNIIKDDNGYTWLATGNGLQRYDGKTWLTFRENKKDSFALPDNHVRFLLQDSRRRLWIATTSGICLFDPLKFNFRQIPIDYHSPANIYPFNSLVMPGDGKVYCSMKPGGLFVLDEKSMRFVPQKFNLPAPFTNIEQIVFDKTARQYWLASENGVLIHDVASQQNYHYNNNPGNHPVLKHHTAQERAIALYLDDSRHLWISFYNRHLGFDLTSGKFIFADSGHVANVKGFYTDKRGITWTYGNELSWCDIPGKTMRVITKMPANQYGINFSMSAHISEDNENNLWLSTDNGAFIFNIQRQHFFPNTVYSYLHAKPIDQPNINGLVKLKDGRLLALGWGYDGIYMYDHEFKQVKPLPGANTLLDYNRHLLTWCGILDSHNQVWIGCQEGMIVQLDPATNRFTKITDTIFRHSTIRSIAEDRDENIWLGTHGGGIYKWIRKENRFIEILPPVGIDAASHVIRLLPDSNNHLWAACYSGGLKRFNLQSGALEKAYKYGITKTPAIPFGTVRDIVMLNNKKLAMATDKGLTILSIEKDTLELLNTSDGLPSNEVSSLVSGKDNHTLWLANRKGISKVDIDSRQITNFGLAEGIKDELFVEASALRLPNGEIFLGSVNGWVNFNSEEVSRHNPPPNVTITGIKLFDRLLPVDSIQQVSKTLRLNYDQNFVTIDFSSMSFLLRGKLDYYYMLEGLHQDWIKADASQQATYTYLPGGHYTFRVQAKSKDGAYSAGQTTLAIHIMPPFWRTWWFYSLCGVAGIALIYLFVRIRKHKRELTEKVRNRIARDLHDDMGSTLSTINILSTMTRLNIETNQGKAKELVEQISENSSRMMESMDDIVWSIDPGNDSMDSIVTRMREFASNLLEAKNIKYSFDIDENVTYLRLDIDKRHDFFMVFKESINNLVKYSQCSVATITLTLVQARLQLLVQDNGKGFAIHEAGEGNGLENMRRRAAALKGYFHIESAAGKGTTISLSIPV